jgi:hypothetical protein
MEPQRGDKNVSARSVVLTDMDVRRPARRMRQVLAVCLVITAASLGILATTALAVTALAVPASGAQTLALDNAHPAAHAEAPPDDPAAEDASRPGAELPHTATGNDGFVVLGLAVAAIIAVALVMAVLDHPRHRDGRRRRQRGSEVFASAPGAIEARSRYSSRSRRS